MARVKTAKLFLWTGSFIERDAKSLLKTHSFVWRMMMKSVPLTVMCFILVCSPLTVYADCPSADATGDCFVDLEDLALLANQWLTGSGVLADMALISGGTFAMGNSFHTAYSDEGSDDELPVHQVTISPFYIETYSITCGQYVEFLNSAHMQGLISLTNGIIHQAGTGSSFPYCDTSSSSSSMIQIDGFYSPFPPHLFIHTGFSVKTYLGRRLDNDPVTGVSWYGAVAYCNWRSQKEGREPCYDLSTWLCNFGKNGYRLPTEAEWEYAARGGVSGKRFPWGDDISHNYANYTSQGGLYIHYDKSSGLWNNPHPIWGSVLPYTSPVDTFVMNGYGLYSMIGNVWEWCHDWYSSTYYSRSPNTNPTGAPKGTSRVLRGGSWDSSAPDCRVSNRFNSIPSTRANCGFRISLKHE